MRRWRDVAVAAALAVVLVDALPTWLPGIRPLDRAVGAVVRPLGLWQGNWRLFAPNPDRLNAWVEARVSWSSGDITTWESPDWQARSFLERYTTGRWHKMIEAVRTDERPMLHDHLARWVAANTAPPADGATPLRVELVRHWWMVPAPGRIAEARERWGRLPPPRDEYPKSATYLVLDLTKPRATAAERPDTDPGPNGSKRQRRTDRRLQRAAEAAP